MKAPYRIAVSVLLALGCAHPGPSDAPSPTPSAAAAAPAPDGVRRLPIETPAGIYEVWTRKVGDHPTKKVLLLHGGPGASHDYLENFADHLPPEGIEIYFYDQLGSGASDRPEAPELWEIDRFVDEVEQVRTALGLDDFVLFGHSWGGILAIEYALAHPEPLAGLIVSNMMASIPAYNRYADEVLKPSMDPAVLAEIEALEAAGDYADPRYVELLVAHHYVDHILRMPADEWPDAVNRAFEKINPDVYVPMQGPSELGASGKLERWDRTADLARIEVPTLVIGATHDTMDPAHIRWMAEELPHGRYHHVPEGSHLAMWEDPETYFAGIVEFVEDVAAGAP